MDAIFTVDAIIALVALTAMEIVLGIDNVVFIAILVGRLPEKQRANARRLGLGAALVMRILLLLSLTWILGMDDSENPVFTLSGLGIPEDWLPKAVDAVTVRDLILIIGGLFLIGKSVFEIHEATEGDHQDKKAGGNASFGAVLLQVAILDIVFSLDSVITAVGMVSKDQLWVMILAIVIAVGVMLVFAGTVGRFVEAHPTLKILALSFLILIGVMLVADGIGTHIDKGYIYFSMAFALCVEVVNLRIHHRAKKKKAL